MGKSDKDGTAIVAAGTTEVVKALKGLPLSQLATSSAWIAFASWGKSCGVKGTELVVVMGKRGMVLEEEDEAVVMRALQVAEVMGVVGRKGSGLEVEKNFMTPDRSGMEIGREGGSLPSLTSSTLPLGSIGTWSPLGVFFPFLPPSAFLFLPALLPTAFRPPLASLKSASSLALWVLLCLCMLPLVVNV